jgi:hypothetical protein
MLLQTELRHHGEVLVSVVLVWSTHGNSRLRVTVQGVDFKDRTLSSLQAHLVLTWF